MRNWDEILTHSNELPNSASTKLNEHYGNSVSSEPHAHTHTNYIYFHIVKHNLNETGDDGAIINSLIFFTCPHVDMFNNIRVETVAHTHTHRVHIFPILICN